MTDKTTDLAQLEREMNEAHKAYNAARARYEQAMIAAQPIKAGDIIKSSEGKIAQVVSVGMRWNDLRIFAVLQKKDGTFGKRPATMWRSEWGKPEIVENA